MRSYLCTSKEFIARPLLSSTQAQQCMAGIEHNFGCHLSTLWTKRLQRHSHSSSRDQPSTSLHTSIDTNPSDCYRTSTLSLKTRRNSSHRSHGRKSNSPMIPDVDWCTDCAVSVMDEMTVQGENRFLNNAMTQNHDSICFLLLWLIKRLPAFVTNYFISGSQ